MHPQDVIFGIRWSTRPSVPLSPGMKVTRTTTFGMEFLWVCTEPDCGEISAALRCDKHRDDERAESTS